MDENQKNIITSLILKAAFNVRNELGRFLSEDNYQEAMAIELQSLGLQVQREYPVAIFYRGLPLSKPRYIDLIVENEIPIELKALRTMGPWEFRQVMCYLELSKKSIGYLINFGAESFTTGIIGHNTELNNGIYRLYNPKAQ